MKMRQGQLPLHRPTVTNVAAEILQQERNAAQKCPTQMGTTEGDIDPEECYEIMQLLEESLYDAIRKEEAQILKQYEEACLQESMSLEARVSEYEEDTRGSVPCPQCQQHPLLQCDAGRVFMCRCGFRFNSQHDGITLDFLRQQLAGAFTYHAQRCTHQPKVFVKDEYGVNLMCLTCNQCNGFSVIV